MDKSKNDYLMDLIARIFSARNKINETQKECSLDYKTKVMLEDMDLTLLEMQHVVARSMDKKEKPVA
jgi:hypothetical protein